MVSSSPAPAIRFTRSRNRGLLAALPLLVPVIVIATLIAVPFSTPMGGFWSDAQQFARTGHILTVFTPGGYPALLGIGLRAAGTSGVVAAQIIVYGTILLAIYSIFRLLALDRSMAIAACALLALHPDVVISIKKIWDTDITTAFLLLLCASLLAAMRKGVTPMRATMIGVLWGLSMSVRPNFPALMLPIAFAFWIAAPQRHRIRCLLINVMLTTLAAVFTLSIVTTLVHGSFYLPQNGPYNLYAGDNVFTERALLINLNAEPSIYPSLVASGFGQDVDVYNPALRPYFVHHALLFIRQNPIVAGKLVLLKLLTLLRPDTKIYPLLSLGGMVKALLALAIPLWLAALVASRHEIWKAEDWLFVMFAVAYILPFLLTNSDPRFRIPLDMLVLTHAFYRLASHRAARQAAIA